MTYVGIIPARYASSRFPGKPLCNICGKTMIQWVYESAKKWPHWQEVYIATDSYLIRDACIDTNIPCIMTGDHHLDCLDRAGEVVDILEAEGRGADRYVVIQGDEPLFNVETLNVDLTPQIVNFYTEVQDPNELEGLAAANAVKVVVSSGNKALYFSRYTVPYHAENVRRSDDDFVCFKQIGVYSFSANGLRMYCVLKPSYNECMEGIGLNRLLDNDVDIDMRYTPHDSVSVDTDEDRLRIIKIIENR